MINTINRMIPKGKFVIHGNIEADSKFKSLKICSKSLYYCLSHKKHVEVIKVQITRRAATEDEMKTVEKSLQEEFNVKLVEFIMSKDFKLIMDGNYNV